MRKLVMAVTLSVMAISVNLGAVSAAKMPRQDVCHMRGNGTYRMIKVNGNAVPAHMAHGDVAPTAGVCPTTTG